MASAAEDTPSTAIRQLFEACDSNHNGYLEIHDLALVCEDLDEDEIQGIFVALDQDGDGRISLEDFAAGFDSVSDTLLSLGKRRRTPCKWNSDPELAFVVFVGRIGRSDWALLRW